MENDLKSFSANYIKWRIVGISTDFGQYRPPLHYFSVEPLTGEKASTTLPYYHKNVNHY